MSKALGHLAEVINDPKNKVEPGMSKEQLKLGIRRFDADGDLYFLWTLERTALILDRPKIGDRDWYAWGRAFILANQNEADGSWQEQWKGVPDTCFALLFLVQADLFRDLRDKLELSQADGRVAACGLALA